MKALFLQILNLSIPAGWVVLAVVFLRLLLHKAPRRIHCALWALVGIRLICPFSFESVFSLIPRTQSVSREVLLFPAPFSKPAPSYNYDPNLAAPAPPNATVGGRAEGLWDAASVFAVIWLTVVALLLFYALFSYLRLRRKVAEAVLLHDNVWECAAVSSPFVLGLFRPRIYLPFGVEESDAACILAHEQAHICRRDHWTKPLGFLLLAVYWFHPLIWLAYLLFCRDIELACDERVVRPMDSEQRRTYATALLNCSVGKKQISVCPLAFGESNVKRRIKNVLNYQKPAFWILCVAVVCSVAAAVCLLSNPKSGDEPCSGFLQPIQNEVCSSADGVSISLESTEQKDNKPVLNVRWDNASSAETAFGIDFSLFRYENGQWVDCCINDQRSVISIAWVLPAGETSVQSYELSDFDLSKPGKYRFEPEQAGGELWLTFTLPDT